MRIPTHIMIHHSATVDGATFSTSAMRRFHRSWRFEGKIITIEEAERLRAAGKRGVIGPWRTIGYHRTVELVGEEFETIVGRGDHELAAACPQGAMNERALHLCFVGNFDGQMPSTAVLQVGIERAVREWRESFGIPIENVVGHRDFNPGKTCPGRAFDLERFREMIPR